MRTRHLLKGLACLVAVTGNADAEFGSLKDADSFVDNGTWVLNASKGEPKVIDFLSNHTLPDDKAIMLGNKQYRFWSVAKHPTIEDKFVLRVHSKKTAGWYSFTWDAQKKAWVSKHWPKISIQKK